MLGVFEDDDRGHLHIMTRGGASNARSRISSLFPLLVCRRGQLGSIRILLDGRVASSPLIVNLFTKVFWEILSMLTGEEHARPLYSFLLNWSLSRKAHYTP